MARHLEGSTECHTILVACTVYLWWMQDENGTSSTSAAEDTAHALTFLQDIEVTMHAMHYGCDGKAWHARCMDGMHYRDGMPCTLYRLLGLSTAMTCLLYTYLPALYIPACSISAMTCLLYICLIYIMLSLSLSLSLCVVCVCGLCVCVFVCVFVFCRASFVVSLVLYITCWGITISIHSHSRCSWVPSTASTPCMP